MNREDIIRGLDWHPAICERHQGSLLDRIEKIVRNAEAAEREACEQIALDPDHLVPHWPQATIQQSIAAAIRARGQA